MTFANRILWFFPILALMTAAQPALAETVVGGPITGVVEWTKAGSPYIVTQDIEIKAGATLKIGPGCVLRFKPNLADQRGLRPFDMEIAVYGTLEATGADGDSVYFTSDAVLPTANDWGGIIIPAPGGRAILKQVVVELASVGIAVQGGQLDITRSAVRACSEKGILFIKGRGTVVRNFFTTVGNFAGTGRAVYLIQSPDVLFKDNLIVGSQTGLAIERGSDARIENNLVSLCPYFGITITSSSPTITRNNITQNEYGIFLAGGSRPKIKDNNIFDNAALDIRVADYWQLKPGETAVDLDMSGNWWGRNGLDVIYDRIEDGTDDPTLGVRVVIAPVLKDAVNVE